MNSFYQNKRQLKLANVGLLLIVLLLFFLNYYNSALFMRPSSYHQWRQADCLSIAKNYYEEGMNFFEPKIHFIGELEMEGRAVSECPILNYTVASLWHVFGEHEFIYRLLEYFIFVAAIFIFFNTLLTFFKSTVLSFFGAGLLLTSPLLVYYSLNFIADVPALSLSIMCFCLFYQFYHTKNTRKFYWALLVGTLAVLLKASALVPISILYFISVVSLSGYRKVFKVEELFTNKFVPAIAILLSLGVLLAWYKFAIYYNNNNQNSVFLLTVLPFWKMEEVERIYNLKNLFNLLFPVFLNKPMFFVFLVLVVYAAVNFKQLPVILKYSFLFGLLYFLLYLIFFFQVFNVHDYYLSNLMIFPIIVFFCCGFLISSTEFLDKNKRFLTIMVSLMFLVNSFHAAAVYRLRMIKDDKMVAWFPFISEDEEKLAQYLFWDYSNGIKKVENFKPALRAHGIKRTDRVITIPDQSFNVSLYFMDLKGHTIARHHLKEDSTVLERVMDYNDDYIVLSDTSLKQELAFKRMQTRLASLFYQDGVEVFKILKK